RAAQAEVRRVVPRAGIRDRDPLVGAVEYLGHHLAGIAALAHARFGDVALHDDQRASAADVGDIEVRNDAHDRFGVVFLDVGVADHAHADAARLRAVHARRLEPSLPLFRPAETLGGLLHHFREEERRTAAVGAAVAPDVLVAVRHIVLLEDIERIEAAFFHDRAQQLLQAAVQLLAAVATHDAGLLAVGDGDVAVEEPVLAFGEHQLSLAQPDADLPLRGVAHAAGIDQPVALHRRHDAFLVRRHGRLDGAAQAHLVGHELLGLAQYDLDRTLGHVRQQGGGHGGVQHRLLVAVAAADV